MIKTAISILISTIILVAFIGMMSIEDKLFDKYCEAKGGVPKHGRGIELCLKPDSIIN